MNYVIETNNLFKRYGKNMVIKGVNMHVPQGCVYGFVGENGSGKTTIMRLLMGLANPTKGSYKLYDVGNKDSKIYAIRNKISAIVEAPSLVPTMTAVDNLKFAAMYYGVSDYSRIPEILKEVGLENTGDKKVKNFSLGMRQRLGIGVLLLNDPQLLLLDEPLNGLDPSGIAEVRDLITSLNKKGITVLISSHILSELEKVANYYGFISHGQLLEEISSEDLAKKCERTINLKYSDLGKLESVLKKIGMKKLEVTPTQIKIRDSIKPLDLLTKLAKLGITIDFIEVSEGNVEDYYLNLIEGGQKND